MWDLLPYFQFYFEVSTLMCLVLLLHLCSFPFTKIVCPTLISSVCLLLVVYLSLCAPFCLYFSIVFHCWHHPSVYCVFAWNLPVTLYSAVALQTCLPDLDWYFDFNPRPCLHSGSPVFSYSEEMSLHYTSYASVRLYLGPTLLHVLLLCKQVVNHLYMKNWDHLSVHQYNNNFKCSTTRGNMFNLNANCFIL